AALVIKSEHYLALISMTSAPAAANVTPGAQLDQAQIAWTAAAEQRGNVIQLRVQMANPARRALRIGLTLIEDSFAQPDQIAQVLAAAPLNDTWQVSIDPASGATEALVGKQPTPLLKVSTRPSPFDTAYFGVLQIYDGEEVVAHAPVFTFRMLAG